MITEEQIHQAEADAAAAQRTQEAAERTYAAAPASGRTLEDFQAAIVTATHAATKARMLRAQRDEEQAARQARTAAEKAAVKDMAATRRRLTKTRDTATQAVAAARAALAVALGAVAAHDQAVREAAGQLRVRGLRCDDGEPTGGGRDGRVRLDGEVWLPLDGPSMLGQLLRGAIAEVVPRHPLGRGVTPSLGGPGAAAGSAELLARVSVEESQR